MFDHFSTGLSVKPKKQKTDECTQTKLEQLHSRRPCSLGNPVFESETKSIGQSVESIYRLLVENVHQQKRDSDFSDVDKALLESTRWTIEVVPGIIPFKEFFDLLANKTFFYSTWLRRRDQLDYLEEPDMLHDTFGHVPFLMHEGYSNFVQQFGELGQRYHDNSDAVLLLERLYWFTIEFGLIHEDNRTKLFGAGIISSFGETNHVFNDNVEIRKFTIENLLLTPFRNNAVQQLYFEAKNAEAVFNCIPETEKLIQDLLTGKIDRSKFRFEEQIGSM